MYYAHIAAWIPAFAGMTGGAGMIVGADLRVRPVKRQYNKQGEHMGSPLPLASCEGRNDEEGRNDGGRWNDEEFREGGIPANID